MQLVLLKFNRLCSISSTILNVTCFKYNNMQFNPNPTFWNNQQGFTPITQLQNQIRFLHSQQQLPCHPPFIPNYPNVLNGNLNDLMAAQKRQAVEELLDNEAKRQKEELLFQAFQAQQGHSPMLNVNWGPSLNFNPHLAPSRNNFTDSVTEFCDSWRQWLPEPNFRRTKNAVEFSVMSYNLLSPEIVKMTSFLYRHCPTDGIDWTNRSSLILKQLLKSNSQIICLQEVEKDFFDKKLVPILGNKGYKGLYKKRTGDHPDGCALFYDTSVFELDSATDLEFWRSRDYLLDRDNIAQIAILRLRECPLRKLVVANTHLLYNPKRGDIKLGQMVLLLAELDKIAFRRFSVDGTGRPIYNPIILCGDMNALPYSELCHFLATGHLTYRGIPCSDISGQREDVRSKILGSELISSNHNITDSCQHVKELDDRRTTNQNYKMGGSKFGTGQLTHDLNLVSVYKESGNGLISTSNIESQTGMIVDYIFYSVADKLVENGKLVRWRENTLRLVSRYSLLTEEQVRMLGGLPNRFLPSDHIAIMARFLLKLK